MAARRPRTAASHLSASAKTSGAAAAATECSGAAGSSSHLRKRSMAPSARCSTPSSTLRHTGPRRARGWSIVAGTTLSASASARETTCCTDRLPHANAVASSSSRCLSRRVISACTCVCSPATVVGAPHMSAVNARASSQIKWLRSAASVSRCHLHNLVTSSVLRSSVVGTSARSTSSTASLGRWTAVGAPGPDPSLDCRRGRDVVTDFLRPRGLGGGAAAAATSGCVWKAVASLRWSLSRSAPCSVVGAILTCSSALTPPVSLIHGLAPRRRSSRTTSSCSAAAAAWSAEQCRLLASRECSRSGQSRRALRTSLNFPSLTLEMN
mmetsp:Transcript_17880/g.46695  ORF Transcript_17880/g.46695 Transcript_17880/m.46695 type:complete len:325 (-) Transcript_17880:121-1095(-)